MGVCNTAGLKSHVRLRNRLRTRLTNFDRRKHRFKSLPLIDYHDQNASKVLEPIQKMEKCDGIN